MTIEDASAIAEKYFTDKILVLQLTSDLLKVHEAGYKECHKDVQDTWDRITAGDPRKDVK